MENWYESGTDNNKDANVTNTGDLIKYKDATETGKAKITMWRKTDDVIYKDAVIKDRYETNYDKNKDSNIIKT